VAGISTGVAGGCLLAVIASIIMAVRNGKIDLDKILEVSV
jgi:hypothetical protein